MINFDFKIAYQFTKMEKQHLKSLRKKYGHFYQNGYGKNNSKVWYDGENKTKQIKHEISKWLLEKSGYRCAYCNKLFIREKKPTDHFIPNTNYPKYSFHPLNLLPCCGYCNETLKLEYNPIAVPNRKYHLIGFKIVHPIIHDVNQHFYYLTRQNNIFDKTRCSTEAIESIRLFQLDSFEMSLERSHQQLIATKFPLTDSDLKRLVAETATYKPKK